MYQNIYLKTIDYNQYQVHLWDSVKGYQTFEWKKSAFVPDPNGEYTTLEGKPVRKTQYYPKGSEVYESDLDETTAFLLEHYGDTDESPKWQNTFFFDIEVSMNEKDLPDPMKGNNPITSVAYYDETTDEWGVYILDTKNELGTDDETDDYKLYICHSEKELLNKFLDKWCACNPTIVTGWNIDMFDIPYLYNRLATVFGRGVANRLSPIGNVRWNKHDEKYKISGVSCLDYIKLYKQFTYTQLSSYRLDYVGNFELGYGKVEYSGTLDDLKRADIRKFIEYNLVDVKIVKELEDKLKFISLSVDICHVGHVSYESIYQSSKWLEGSIICYLRRTGKRVADNKPAPIEGSESDGFTGAFVKEPVPGRYDYIYDLDLTSMYPSIIMSLNISPEMKKCKILNTDWDIQNFVRNDYNGIIQIYKFYDGNTININGSELKDFVIANDYSLSSNGIMYQKSKKKIVGKIL